MIEIFFTKKIISKNEWENLLKIVGRYVGYLKEWKIFIILKQNKFRFFIDCNCSLPPSINNLDAFLLKKVKDLSFPKNILSFPMYLDVSKNIIDISEYFEIKTGFNALCFEIKLRNFFNKKEFCKTYIYVKNNNKIKKYKLLISLPATLLQFNLEVNKRFQISSCPKYLDITKQLHILRTEKANSLVKVDTFPYLQGDFYLSNFSYNFAKHSCIFGASGCGKSKFISLFIKNLYNNKICNKKYKFVVIDPHASLENDIGGLGKVIDFKSRQDTINLFDNNCDVVAATELLIELFKSLLADQYNSKVERVLRHAINLLLTANNFNFTSLRKLLLDVEYRNEIILNNKKNLNDSVINFFLTDFNDLKVKSYTEAISPIIAFIDEMEMLPVFNGKEVTDNLDKEIEENFLTLFSLDRTKLGDKITKTIAGLIMQQLLTLIQNKKKDYHIIFIVDEVAVVENPILCRFLSEARKYNLSLIIAGQYFSQISEKLKSAIFANVVNYYIFRVSRIDAVNLVDNFNMTIPLNNSTDEKIKLLSSLKNRELIMRIEKNGTLLPALKAITLDYICIPRKKINYIKEESQDTKNHKVFNFSGSSSVKLNSILKNTSTSRKVVK